MRITPGGLRSLCVAPLAVAFLAMGSPAARAAGPPLPSADPFYAYSGSLGPVAPGTVLRSRAVQVAEAGASTPVTATQVLYRTTGERGQPTVTVATVLRPVGVAPPIGIVSYQMAYDALSPKCDPSFTLRGGYPAYASNQLETQAVMAYLAHGDTVVVPDYEGEHLDWVAGQESGYGTLDGIRAAEHLLGARPQSAPVGMFGYSGGSIATDFAAESAPAYAPELRIAGTAIGGVPVDFFHLLRYIDGKPQWGGVIPGFLAGLGRAFGLDLNPYLSPFGRRLLRSVQSECIDEFPAQPGITMRRLAAAPYPDLLHVRPLVEIFNRLIMGRTGTPEEPMLIGAANADGTGDDVIVTADVQGLAHAYCARGVPVQLVLYRGLHHTPAAFPFELDALNFLTERLSGVTPPDGCSSIGPGNSLAPERLPAAPVVLQLSAARINPRRHGLVIELLATTGTVRGVVVRLLRGHATVATAAVARVTARPERVILRAGGRAPSPGRYTVTVRRHGRLLAVGHLRVR